MEFYTQPAFWALITSLFGLLKMFFVYYEKSQEKGAKLDMSVERFRSDNIQKSVDYLNGVMSRIEPMVTRHEALAKNLEESAQMVSVIEKGLRQMMGDLSKQCEGFENRITKITSSFQLLVDRVDKIDKDFKLKLGIVTRKP